MGAGKGIGLTLGVVLLLVKIGLLAGRSSSSYRPSYSTYSTRDAHAYAAFEKELRKIEEEAARAREELVSHQCPTAPIASLSVEVLWLNPQMRRVGLASRDEALGRIWPASVELRGLSVGVRQDDRSCAHNDRALVDRVIASKDLPPLKALGKGAWLVSTTGERAAETLLMPKLQDALKVKGELLAFAPSDNLIAYADSADPKAIALAVQAAADLVDESGNSGCLTEDVLVFRGGQWVKHTGIVGGPVRTAALECQTHQTSDLLIDLALTSTRTNASIDVLAAPRSHVKGKRRASLDRTGEQLVAAADEAVIDGKVVPFAKLPLDPITLDGTPVTGFFLFHGVSEAELAKLTGTKWVAKLSP